jgi:hypothetical protein
MFACILGSDNEIIPLLHELFEIKFHLTDQSLGEGCDPSDFDVLLVDICVITHSRVVQRVNSKM